MALKPRDPFRGAAGGSFLEQRLVIEPTRRPAVVFSLSTERVLHDPAGLFVHLCVSTCDGKR